jgi:hypothetical protein
LLAGDKVVVVEIEALTAEVLYLVEKSPEILLRLV